MISRRRMAACAAVLLVSSCSTSGAGSTGAQRPVRSSTTTATDVGLGLIAFEKGTFGEDERLAFFDPSTKEVTMVPGGERGYYARFSQDGSMLVWSRLRKDRKGTDGVMVHDLRTGKTRKIANGGGCPAFAPDGRSVVVSGAERIHLDSAKAESLPGPKEGCRIELADGRFVFTNHDEKIQILDGEDADTIYEAPGTRLDTASLSPDASKLAFVRERQIDERWEVDLMVMEIDGSNPESVAHGLAYGTGWSPDSRSLVTSDFDKGEEARSLWVLDTVSNELDKVLPGPGSNPTWGPTAPEE